jgi:multidrug resistance efflux pump
MKAAFRGRRMALVAGGGAAIVAAAAFGFWWMLGSSTDPNVITGETARTTSDRMIVTVVEGGEIDAKRSTNVINEVEGQSTIVWVIEEGLLVKQGDKLVQLDSADLQERLCTQDMVYKTSKAAYEKSEKTFLITQSTRESLLAEAGLKVKFAHMDLRKYLGADLADRVVAQEGKGGFETLVREPALGGAALQEKRKLQSEIDLVSEELSRAASKVEWTRTLEKKGYVTGSELQADELAHRRQQVALDQARTALDLFLQYEFPKSAEKAYTDWLEAKREYDRVDARTNSELDSARADRDTKQEARRLEETRFKKVQDQLAKCTICAPQPGMVVYDAGAGRWDRAIIIEPGAVIRHQQNLIKLPDLSEMNVKVKLHESVVKQVSDGAQAYVTIDAFPKDRLTGRVTKIGIMPDRSQWWLNPGLKSYLTEITLDATPKGLKPGMSAQVEILVDTKESVLQVPIAAVFIEKGFQVAYVKTPMGPETRRVEAGLSNERMVEITRGLAAGDEVYLFKPPGAEELKVSEEEQRATQKQTDWKAAERAAVPAAETAAPPKVRPPRERSDKSSGDGDGKRGGDKGGAKRP